MLTAINYVENGKWLWQCDCGKQKIIKAYDVKCSKTKSCGCLHSKLLSERNKNNCLNLIGKKFGKLTVIKQLESRKERSNWLCQCDCGNFKEVTSDLLIKGETKSCGCLNSSYGEEIIETILKENNIIYKKEFSFKELVSDNNIPLRFDFAIFNNDNTLKCLIEYDGEQHYLKKSDKIFSDTLENRQYKDNQKNQYCIQNNILLYRIPYWVKNEITLDLITSDKYLIKEL